MLRGVRLAVEADDVEPNMTILGTEGRTGRAASISDMKRPVLRSA